jgi:hypothetical protein
MKPFIVVNNLLLVLRVLVVGGIVHCEEDG